jgi:hypothetical protein
MHLTKEQAVPVQNGSNEAVDWEPVMKQGRKKVKSAM